LRNLQGEILEENRAMLHVVHHHGVVVLDRPEPGVVRVAVGAAQPMPLWPEVNDRPRLLVEAQSGRWRVEHAVRTGGFHVAICPGPRAEVPCPALAGQPCPLVAGCDAVVITDRAADPVPMQLA
jgi:hypothetical protein